GGVTMFNANPPEGKTISLTLTGHDAAFLYGLVEAGASSGNPLVAMAAERISDLMREAVIANLDPEAASAGLDDVDEILAEHGDDMPEAAREKLARIRSQIEARANADENPGSTDMSGFDAAFEASADDETEPA